MTIDRFRANLEAWGCLVKSWATKLDYVGDGQYSDADFAKQPPRAPWAPAASAEGKPWALPAMTAVTVPAEGGGTANLPAVIALSRQQFLARLEAANVSDSYLPDQYTTCVIVQGDVDTLVLRLPPIDKLQASEDDIIKNGYSDPPKFYQDLYTPPGATPIGPFMPAGQTAEMKLHADRIGDYSMGLCQ